MNTTPSRQNQRARSAPWPSIFCCALIVISPNLQPTRVAAQETQSIQPSNESAASASATNAPDEAPSAPSARRPVPEARAAILDPTQGRPVILQRGDQFRFLMRLGEGVGGDVTLRVRHSRVPSQTLDLIPAGDMAIFQKRYASVALRLPDDMPTGMYDLILDGASKSLEAVHAIKVVDGFKTRFRFIHLSDMTIDDPSAPAFDDRLVEEVNLLAPEFIVATGDFTAWSRMLDDAASWKRVLAYLARFDAPVFVVCGDHDHQEGFSEYVAQSPVGTFNYGDVHGLLLLDHAHHTMDREQLDFIRLDLRQRTGATFNMMVVHQNDLGFLDQLVPEGSVAEYLSQRKVRMIITGGSDDWDRIEYADRVRRLDDIHYIRTHQASTCLRGRATGVSHYRVIEVDGERITYLYPSDTDDAAVDHSIPVGHLRVFDELAPRGQVAVSIQNALNQAFTGARVWLAVPTSGDFASAGTASTDSAATLPAAKPAVSGGRLIQAIPTGDGWLCEVAVDLPEKGGVKVIASAAGTPLPPVPFESDYQGPEELHFTAQQTPEGVTYYSGPDDVAITLKNNTDQPVRTVPVLRLNGNLLALEARDQPAWPVTVPASGAVTLRPEMRLRRLTPGPSTLQLIFLEDPARRVTTFPVTLKSAP